MKNLKILLSFSGLSLLMACATPEVVSERQPGDAALSCSELAEQVRQAEEFAADARGEKGVTGTNVAAGLLFWPALLVTYSNAEEAIDAANDRKDYLYELADAKGCKT